MTFRIAPVLFAASLAAVAGTAVAGPTCTDTPQDRWIPADRFRQQLADAGYRIDVFKVTKGQCYEIYGHDKAGKKVEVYFDPVNGKVVKSSH